MFASVLERICKFFNIQFRKGAKSNEALGEKLEVLKERFQLMLEVSYMLKISLVLGGLFAIIFFFFTLGAGDVKTTQYEKPNPAKITDRFWETFEKVVPPPAPKPIETLPELADLLEFDDESAELARMAAEREIRMRELRAARASFFEQAETEIIEPYRERYTGESTFYEDQSKDDTNTLKGMVPNANDPSYPIDMERVIVRGHPINAVLMVDIRSELPSNNVRAMVDEDVYGFHGRKILIPKGTQFLGSYQPLDGPGDTRLGITWERFITPNGMNAVFNSESAGPSGIAGLTGEVDRRLQERYAFPLVTTAALIALSEARTNEQQNQSQALDAGLNELSAVNAQVIEESLAIDPIVTIGKGKRIIISPEVDVVFQDPRGATVTIEPLLQEKEKES